MVPCGQHLLDDGLAKVTAPAPTESYIRSVNGHGIGCTPEASLSAEAVINPGPA